MTIGKFRSRVDEQVLRQWMHRLADSPVEMNPTRLHGEVEKKVPPGQEFISRKAVSDFWHGGEGFRATKLAAYSLIWEHLKSDDAYLEYFPADLYRNPSSPIPNSASDQLSLALTAFFSGKGFEKNTTDDIRIRLPGNYVLYYPDQRLKKSGKSPQPLARATILKITDNHPFGLRFTELQEWKAKPPFQVAVTRRHEGVSFLFHKCVVALLDCNDYASFKCIVVTKLITEDLRDKHNNLLFTELKGEILAIEQDGPLPSVQFLARRFDLTPPNHGTMPYEYLDNEVVNHIKLSDRQFTARSMDDPGDANT